MHVPVANYVALVGVGGDTQGHVGNQVQVVVALREADERTEFIGAALQDATMAVLGHVAHAG